MPLLFKALAVFAYFYAVICCYFYDDLTTCVLSRVLQ